MNTAKFFLSAAAMAGFFSVSLGAFGAHGLKKVLEGRYLEVFHTGVEYQFYHSFALALVGLLLLRGEARFFVWSGYAFLAGILVFSGSLYLLALTRVGLWGAVTPLGGLSFLVGWIFLLLGVRQL